jgi:hypothetical protein
MKPREGWRELSEHEIGRPHLLACNPVFDYEYDTQGNALTNKGTYLEVVAWDLFDSFQIALNQSFTGIIQMFVQGQGAPLIDIGSTTNYNKTILHTNMGGGQGAVLPNPQRFMTKALQAYTRPDITLTDLTNLGWTCVINFTVGDNHKSYFAQDLAKLPSGAAAIVGSVAGTASTANTGSWFQVGYPINSNLYCLSAGVMPNGKADSGVPINQGQNFEVDFDPTENVSAMGGNAPMKTQNSSQGGNGIFLKISLVGTLARSVG